MATVACKCGEKFYPSPEHYGKEVLCRKCGRTVTLIPDPSLDPPPPPPRPPLYTYAAAPSPQSYNPLDNANQPVGLNPKVRRILIYAAIVCAIVSIALLVVVFREPTAPKPPGAPATDR
jgi:hypothetical protein